MSDITLNLTTVREIARAAIRRARSAELATYNASHDYEIGYTHAKRDCESEINRALTELSNKAAVRPEGKALSSQIGRTENDEILNRLIERTESLKSLLAESVEPIANDLGDVKNELQSLARGRKSRRIVADIRDADDAIDRVLESISELGNDLDSAVESMRAALGERS